MISFLVGVIIALGILVMTFAMLWDGSRQERDLVGKLADEDHKAIERLKGQVRESGLALGRANDRHTAAEKRCVDAWKALETEKVAREQDGITATARYGQLVAERDALRRKLEVRGAELGMMLEVMAEWLRSHSYKVEG